MWARGGVCRDGARVPLPWTEDTELNHGFFTEPEDEPWLPVPSGWGAQAMELQQQDPESSLPLVSAALELRRKLWKNEVFGPNDGGIWWVEPGNLLIC
jgi:alpha-glucosidase